MIGLYRRTAILAGIIFLFTAPQTSNALPKGADGFDLDAVIEETERLKAIGKWREAGEKIEEAFDAAARAGADDESLISLVDEGSDILLNLEDLIASARFGERALVVLGERGNALGIARAQILLAQSYYWSDEIEKAEALLASILSAAARGAFDDPDAETTATAYSARAMFRAGDNDEAITTIESYIADNEAFEKASKDPRYVLLRQLALAYRNKSADAGRPALEKALHYARKAAETVNEAGAGGAFNYPVALESVARIEWMLDLRAEAIAHLREAIADLEGGGLTRTRDFVLMTAYLCDRLTKIGEIEEGIVWGERSYAIARDIFLERYRGPNGASQDDRVFLNFAIANYLTALRKRADGAARLSSADFDAAFSAAQLASMSEIADAMSVTSVEIREATPRLRRATAKIREMRARIDEIDFSASLFAADPARYSSQLADLQRERSGLIEDLARREATLAGIDPSFYGLWGGDSVGLPDLQRSLGSDEAFIQLHAASDTIHVFAVTREKYFWGQSRNVDNELCDRVTRLRNSLSATTSVGCNGVVTLKTDPELSVFEPDNAFRLFELTFGAADDVLAEKRGWTISAHGLLASLPYPALLSRAAPTSLRSSPRYADLSWLGAERAILLAPSASSFIAMRAARVEKSKYKSAHGRRIAAAGAPCLGRYDSPDCTELMETDFRREDAANGEWRFRNVIHEKDAAQELSELPGAYAEIQAIKSYFPEADISLTGSGFQKHGFINRNWDDFSAVSLSTHAIQISSETGAESAIVFSPAAPQSNKNAPDRSNILKSSEIAALSMPVDWAILSSCNTIAGGSRQDDAISGLALAFMQAGAEAIVFSTFEVRDDASNAIIPAMLQAYADDSEIGKANALRQTVAEILGDMSKKDLHHPSAWAPFAIMGAGQ